MPRVPAIDCPRGLFLRAVGAALLAIGCSGRTQPHTDSKSTVPAERAVSLLNANVQDPADPSRQQHGPEARLSDRDIDWQANAVMRTLGNIARTVKHTEYAHSQRVNIEQGLYVFDCSLMAQWVLKRATPVAAQAMSRGLSWRPLAADFQRRIASVPANIERRGWRRVERVQDALPGDVIAWLKPKIIDSKNTGHVAFVVLPPVRVTGYSDAYLVRIADATSLLHADDTRGNGSGSGSGFGFGTILLVVDPDTGAPRAYGWVGLEWRAFETPIAMGRPLR
jgi:hypothetical protein